jgi:hypothetical protein
MKVPGQAKIPSPAFSLTGKSPEGAAQSQACLQVAWRKSPNRADRPEAFFLPDRKIYTKLMVSQKPHGTDF